MNEVVKDGVYENVGGRPSVETDPSLQAEYYKIYDLHTRQDMTYAEISQELEVSESKVNKACNWVRNNWLILADREYWIDAEKTYTNRIAEKTQEIVEVKFGKVKCDRITGLPIILPTGQELREVDMKALIELSKVRKSYEDTRNEIRGVIGRQNMVVSQTATVGDTYTILRRKMNIFEVMEEPDKQKLIEIFDKYGVAP